MTDNFDAKALYGNAVKMHTKAEEEAYERSRVLSTLYNEASKELGYSQKQLANNKDAQKEVARLMFSDKYAGNKELNPLLGSSSFYKGFSKDADEPAKQMTHKLALGTNYHELMALIERYGNSFNSKTFSHIVDQHIVEPHITQSLDIFLAANVVGPTESQKKNYAALAAQDPNIDSVDPKVLDFEEVREMARKSIQGKAKREDLEERVGVMLPKYDWQRAA